MRRAFFFIGVFLFASASFASIPPVSALDDAPPIGDALSETRIRVSEVLDPFERPAESELTRAVRQAYEQATTTNASGLRRFLSVDPGGFDPQQPQSWNRYTYALNNPVNRVDPDGKRSYLVARNGPGGASHMFIVTHARYLGDPQAVVRSWGNSSGPRNPGSVGRVGLRTTGMSAGTYAQDVRTWKSFGRTDAASKKTAAQTDYTAIAAKDGKVASVADAVIESNRYKLDGPNSNSAAQAVADRAQESPVPTPDAFDTPTGVDEKDKIKFDELKIKDDENAGAHNVHVPPV